MTTLCFSFLFVSIRFRSSSRSMLADSKLQLNSKIPVRKHSKFKWAIITIFHRGIAQGRCQYTRHCSWWLLQPHQKYTSCLSTYHSIEPNIHFIIIMVYEFMCAFVTFSKRVQQSSRNSSKSSCYHCIQASTFRIANRQTPLHQPAYCSRQQPLQLKQQASLDSLLLKEEAATKKLSLPVIMSRLLCIDDGGEKLSAEAQTYSLAVCLQYMKTLLSLSKHKYTLHYS